jgi:hypothetical protein
VTVTIDAAPEFINDCNCTLCRKSGAAWGYFTSASATASGPTAPYVRADKAAPAVEVHSCARCGATTHFVLTTSFRSRHPGADLVGVNMRLFDPDEFQGVEIRFPDGRAWSGEGPYEYRRAALTGGEGVRW